jgi:hypothetical protein
MSQGSTMILEPPAVTRRGRSRNSRAVPQSRTPAPTAEIAGVMVGTFAGFNPAGVPLVKFLADSAMEPATARSIVPLKSTDAGRELVLMFEAGDSRLPIVMGFVMPSAPGAVEVAEPVPAIDARVDGQRVVLEAEQEIVLQCGKASITLTRAGKVLIRGAYVLTRSSGANRIKGASVQIN